MDPLIGGLREAGQAVIGLLSLPYLYIAVLLVWWHARQGVTLQRRLFHVRLYGTLTLTLLRLGAGALAGLALSVVSFAAGAQLSSETLLCVWIGMFVLALFRLRYVCLAYAAGALGIVQAILSWTVDAGSLNGAALQDVVRVLEKIDVPGLLFLAGILHLAEGLLVRLQGARTAIPLFLEGKRGKPLGAYALSGVWPVPLLWLIPAAGADGFTLPWNPLFGADGAAAVWTLTAFPVLIGFSDRTETFWPEQKAKTSGSMLMLYGVLLAALAAGAVFWPPLAVVASVAAFLLHEGLVWFSRWHENGRLPLFTQDGTGVKILAVLPGTPAAEMGLAAGEIIRRVNGTHIRTKEDLHAALQKQSAFCKMEVANREGHTKYLQRARYAGEHHQLGLVLAPDEHADYVAAPGSPSLWQSLQNAGARRRKGTALARLESGAGEAEMAAGEPEETFLDDDDNAAEFAGPPEDPGLPPRTRR